MLASTSTAGLVYRRLDLHIHTPASECFEDKSVTPEAIINKALSQRLDAIAITDHNTGVWVDKIKAASKGKLVIFPGVEVSATGGKSGIHILAIFDPTKTTKDVENLLGALGIKADKYGKPDALTSHSPSQVINIISEHEGLAILAHANSDKGVMGDVGGQQRIDILQNPNLSAAEATDFANAEKQKRKRRVVDLLNGSHPDYPELAVYQASDNLSLVKEGKHCVDAIGSRFTYFKLDEISLEGLRQCFCDPSVRIRQHDEYRLVNSPRIETMKVSQGFLEHQTIHFHEGLNSIVGGKGTGKSLVVEFLRFALQQPSADTDIQRDHSLKLQKRLEPFGNVVVEFRLDNGTSYRVTRTYDGTSNLLECCNLETNESYEGDLQALLPILAYSQNEVIRIAEDEQAQLRLVDSFIDSSSYDDTVRQLHRQLNNKAKELAASIRASSEVASYKKELSSLTEQLKNIDRALKHKLFEDIKQWENKKKAFEKYVSIHEYIERRVQEFMSESDSDIQVPEIQPDLIGDALIKRAKRLTDNSKQAVLRSLDKAMAILIKNNTELNRLLNGWLPAFEKKNKAYEQMLIQAGGDKRKLEAERRKLGRHKDELEKQLEKYTLQQDKLTEALRTWNELLDQLEASHFSHYKVRERKFDEFTAQSGGRLRLRLEHASNSVTFKEELLALRRGTRIREADIDKVAQSLMPRKLVELIISGDARSLAQAADLADENASKLIDALNSRESFDEILSLAYKFYPEDTPSIKFRKDDGNYEPLSELSTGQKCAALLIIALSEGTRPIIIDQPEDSLDNPSVYEDVVTKLRSGKEKRQFILTTHNSSVGVASDSDNFIVLKSTSTRGSIECFGAIDREKVRRQIIQHLEGGPKPYRLRSKKYNVRN